MKLFNLIPIDFILGFVTASFFWAAGFVCLYWWHRDTEREITDALNDVLDTVNAVRDKITEETEEKNNHVKDN